MDALEKQQEAEKAEQMKLDAMNNSFFGADFVTGPTEAQVAETNAAGELSMQAYRQSPPLLVMLLLRSALREPLRLPTRPNRLSPCPHGTNWLMYRATCLLAVCNTGLPQEAKANGLIRPGAQGLQDIQNLNRKFAEATGLMQAAMADPKFVADNFTGKLRQLLRMFWLLLHLKVRREIKSARDSKVNSNIATAFAGVGANSSAADLGQAWNAANLETLMVPTVDVCLPSRPYSTTQKVKS